MEVPVPDWWSKYHLVRLKDRRKMIVRTLPLYLNRKNETGDGQGRSKFQKWSKSYWDWCQFDDGRLQTLTEQVLKLKILKFEILKFEFLWRKNSQSLWKPCTKVLVCIPIVRYIKTNVTRSLIQEEGVNKKNCILTLEEIEDFLNSSTVFFTLI